MSVTTLVVNTGVWLCGVHGLLIGIEKYKLLRCSDCEHYVPAIRDHLSSCNGKRLLIQDDPLVGKCEAFERKTL